MANMKLVLLGDTKNNMAFCSITDDHGFATSELGVGWIHLNDNHNNKVKGDAINIPDNLIPEFYEKPGKDGTTWQRIRFLAKD